MRARHRHATGEFPWQRVVDFSLKHRLTMLLVLETFTIFGLSPLIDLGVLPHPLLGATFSLILIAGMLSIDNRVLMGRLIIGLGIAMLPVQLWRYLLPDDLVLIVHPVGLICFMIALSAAVANTLFRSPRIKLDQVLGGVVLYLNIGLTFAIAYSLVEHVSPGAFALPNPSPPRPLHPSYFVYFSFVTLTTVGYGDTVPVAAMARSLTILEAAMGQLYPAIILARLVSIEVGQTSQKRARSEHRQEVTKNHGGASGHL